MQNDSGNIGRKQPKSTTNNKNNDIEKLFLQLSTLTSTFSFSFFDSSLIHSKPYQVRSNLFPFSTFFSLTRLIFHSYRILGF